MASLIGFDKNRENLQFKDHCKLSINFMSNYLYVEPVNEKFKLISASFKWKYVMKKNFLFVFAEFDFLDFCLVFRNEQICKKTYDYIASVNKDNEPTDAISVNDSFFNPIFQTISNNPTINSDLTETIATWYQILGDDEKEIYNQMMKDYGIHDIITAAIPVQTCETVSGSSVETGQSNLKKTNRKRKHTEIKQESITEKRQSRHRSKQFSEIIPSSQFQIIHVALSHYRTLIIFTSENKQEFHQFKSKSSNGEFKCITCRHKAIIGIDDNGEICVKTFSKKHLCDASNTIPSNFKAVKLVRKPEYEIYENCSKKSSDILVIFDQDDRNLCYEYFWASDLRCFQCMGCAVSQLGKKKNKSKLFNEGTECEYLEIIDEHVCEKRKFELQKYRQDFDYILRPDFEIQKYHLDGKERQRLIIFDKNDRSKCYRYCFREGKYYCRGCEKIRKLVTAKLRLNSEGSDYVILSNAKHVCEMLNYQPENDRVLKPYFDIQKFCHNGKEGQRLIIFDANDRSKCYQYFYIKTSKKFCCYGCNKKRIFVTAKLKENSEGEDFIVLSNTKHVCEMKTYVSNEKLILRSPHDFEIMEKTNDGLPRLFVFESNDKKKCYVFRKDGNAFYCAGCKAKVAQSGCKSRNAMLGKLFKNDENGELLFQIDAKREHICEPRPYQPVKYESPILPKTYDFFYYREKEGPLKFAVYLPDNKKSCFLFLYHKRSNGFECCACRNKKKSFRIKPQKDDDGKEYLFHDYKKHICKPTQVSSICPPKFVILKEHGMVFGRKPKPAPKIDDKSKIIKMPDFKLDSNKDGIRDSKLIIFVSTDKTLCYEYFLTKRNNYLCIKCNSKKKSVSAKLHKDDENGESFFLLGKIEHVCDPVKYVSSSDDSAKIIKMPNFELRPNRAGVPDSKLIVLHPTDKTLCFEYGYVKRDENFKCNKCHSKKLHVYAKLKKDYEKQYIEMGKKDHICEPIKLSSISKSNAVKIDDESKIVNQPNFELRPNNAGVPDKKLIIRHCTDRSLCYEYFFENGHQSFRCTRCHAKKMYVTAKLHKDDKNDENFILMGKKEHVCEPVKYHPL